MRCSTLRLGFMSQLAVTLQTVSPVHHARLGSAVRGAWSAATSSDPEWSPDTPSLGQCAVTALLVQDWFGGRLLRATVGGVSHYWNILRSGEELDLTREQFAVFEPVDVELRSRDYVLSFPDTDYRYQLLVQRVEAEMQDDADALPSPA